MKSHARRSCVPGTTQRAAHSPLPEWMYHLSSAGLPLCAQQEGEAYMGEIESVGQAYEDMQVWSGDLQGQLALQAGFWGRAGGVYL